MNEVGSLTDNKHHALISYAMRLLAQRDHSEMELRRKLAVHLRRVNNKLGESAFSEEPQNPVDSVLIDQTIAYGYQHNWLNDQRFASRFIASRSRRGYGAQRIRSELMQKGIDKEIVHATLVECDIDWYQHAREAAWRKFGFPLSLEWKAKAKVQRYLLYRGFFQEEIQSIYREFAQ